MTIMQGDQVIVALTLTNDDGDIITDYGVEEVVVTIGSIEVKTQFNFESYALFIF